MKKILLLSTILSFGLYSTESSAQLFKLEITGNNGLPPEAITALRTALDEVEADINKDFPSTNNPKRLMQGMANSSVMAGKGIGSDYASRMQVFLVGGGIGVGADLEKDKETGSDISGVGIQGGLVIGTNLGWMDAQKVLGLYTDRLNIYFNYIGYNLDRKMGDGNKDSIEAKLRSFGFHANYDLVKPKGTNLLRWGGIKVHTGFEYNTTQLTFSTTLNQQVTATIPGGGGATVSGPVSGKPQATIDVATQSIPIEISTNVQLLYFLSLYTGLGADINFGKAKADGALNAEETTVTSSAGGSAQIQATANINGSGAVDSLLTRAFVGIQFNIPYANIFVQADKAFGNDLIGATAGLRLVY
jgi:hypothetical protein